MKECCIFAGAKIENYLDIIVSNSSYIICADGGYLHAKRLAISPNVVIGDFDTISDEIIEDCEIIKYPSKKNDTDTMLAIKLAIDRNCRDIKIYGCVGGRLDHTIANIQSLVYIIEHGATAALYGDNEIITLLNNGKTKLKKLDGYYFSIFSYSEKCVGVTTSGTKYNLTDATLNANFPLGVSNEILNDFCEIEVKTGILLIIFSKR